MQPDKEDNLEMLVDSHKQQSDPSLNKPPLKRGKNRNGLTSLEALLPQVMGGIGLEKRLKEHSFMQLWFNVCGAELKDRSRPLYMDYQRNLVVGAQDAATAQEISLMRKSLLSSLGRMARALGIELTGIRVDLKNFHEPQSFIPPVDISTSLPEPTPEGLAQWALDDNDLALLKKVSEEVDTAMTNLGPSTSQKSMIGNKVLQLLEQQLKLRSWRRHHGYPICQSCNLPAPRLHVLKTSNICFNCTMDRD